jgi:hypothetical protein
MKANKAVLKYPEVELTGKVIQKKFGPGSKSEHQAIFFETNNGTYQLRRAGENAFSDPGLKKFIGKQVNATGRINASLFLASKVEKVEDGK